MRSWEREKVDSVPSGIRGANNSGFKQVFPLLITELSHSHSNTRQYRGGDNKSVI